MLGDEPLLFHTGMRQLFAPVSDAISTVTPISGLRWVAFGHLEADECGSLNQFLAAAPRATAAQGATGCMVSVGDLADRPPKPLADGETLDIGGHELQWLDTPHVPHSWEAGLLYDVTTRTLLCGDIFSLLGRYPASTNEDIAARAIADDDSSWMSLAPSSPATLRRLASLEIDTLAPMHGPAYTGDCRRALLALADRLPAPVSTRRLASPTPPRPPVSDHVDGSSSVVSVGLAEVDVEASLDVSVDRCAAWCRTPASEVVAAGVVTKERATARHADRQRRVEESRLQVAIGYIVTATT